jgi:hypothetical protein
LGEGELVRGEGVEVRGPSALRTLRHGADPLARKLCPSGHHDLSTVLRVAAARGETGLLQPVDQCCHGAAGRESEAFGELTRRERPFAEQQLDGLEVRRVHARRTGDRLLNTYGGGRGLAQQGGHPVCLLGER